MLKRRLLLIAFALVALLGSVVVLFFVGVVWPLRTLEPIRTSTPLAIVDVTVIDVPSGTTRPSQTVVIDRGRIVETGGRDDVVVPSDVTVIDGAGLYLLPALWDMHTHVYAVSPMLDLPLYIAYGVTSVRDMQGCPQPDDPFIACASDKRRWSSEAIAGERVGPRIVSTASWMANGPGMVDRLGDVPLYFDTATPKQARQFVRHHAGSVDAIKVYDRLPRDAYLALVAEAKKLDLEVVGHRPHAVSAVEAAAHQKSLEHARFLLHESFPGSEELRSRAGTSGWREDRRRMLDEHDPVMAAAIFEAMREHGTWYVPTHLTRWSDAWADHPSVRRDPLLRYLHPLMKRQWLEDVDEVLARDPSPEARETYREFHRKGLELTGAAHRAGVRILAGTDYIVAGADLHRELEQLVAAGLTPRDALYAATVAPAEYFGAEMNYGAVAPGKVADLLLLDANPLEDIRNTQRIAAVVFQGNLYDREALQTISDHVERQAQSWTVGCKMIWRFVRNPGGY
ncbi:MAG: amidohydrolase family protein [Acidobacteria bacterium]|nr:amidohydrolase family protein [Acidobacteriota bacterium]